MSLKTELREAAKLPFESWLKELSNVSYPTFFKLLWLIPFYLLNRKDIIEENKAEWFSYEEKIKQFFKEAGLKYPENVTCHLHVFGPYGWYNKRKNIIHVRYNAWLGTTLHELIHLAVSDPTHTPEEAEEAVHKYDKLAKKITGLEI